jgi:DNA-binding NtrC family response regulator
LILLGAQVLKSRVLLIEDETQFQRLVHEYLSVHGYEVLVAGTCEKGEELWREARPDAAVIDYQLPDGTALDLLPRLKSVHPTNPVIILTGHGSIELAVEAVKLGAEQFLTKPPELKALLAMIQRALENQRNRQNREVEQARKDRNRNDPFLGSSPVIKKLEETCQKLRSADTTILIQAETGTGKGVLARWFHQNGPRAAETFVDLNCAGLSRELLETELFGHQKGAFTGAVQNKTGLFELAHRGILFLDEIGDIDLAIQPKLLKVLEDKQFRRLGDIRDKKVDTRLIAATHRDLGRLVQEQRFRDDLYFRISTIRLAIPPLRERIEDIPVLARHLLDSVCADLGCPPLELSAEALKSLGSYSWPGNIRELRNLLERAALLKGSGVIGEKDLYFDPSLERLAQETRTKTLEEMEREYIALVLRREKGHVESAARRLGIPRSSLYHKLKQYGLSRSSDEDAMGAAQGH